MPHRFLKSQYGSFVGAMAVAVALATGLAAQQMASAAAAHGSDHAVSASENPPPLEPRRADGPRPSRSNHAAASPRATPPNFHPPLLWPIPGATADPSAAPSPAASPAASPPEAREDRALNAAVANPQAGAELPTLANRVFAGVENLQLHLPHGVRAIGFHESADRRALPMHPVGIPRANDNMTRLARAPVSDGFEYIIMNTRNRHGGPTTAVDISIPHNTLFTSPVTGTVAQVQTYALYRSVPDNAVYIIPDTRPDLLVVVMHLNGVKVAEGDRVVAGKDVLALTARQLPFVSQIDRYAGVRPHAHVELRRR